MYKFDFKKQNLFGVNYTKNLIFKKYVILFGEVFSTNQKSNSLTNL